MIFHQKKSFYLLWLLQENSVTGLIPALRKKLRSRLTRCSKMWKANRKNTFWNSWEFAQWLKPFTPQKILAITDWALNIIVILLRLSVVIRMFWFIEYWKMC